MNDFRIRTYWPSCLGVAVAIALAGWSYQVSRAHRMSVLDLSAPGCPDTYIMRSKTEPSRCYVVHRRQSTMRRSDAEQPGRQWSLAQIGPAAPDDGQATWMASSKREGKGTAFFVPVEDVRDWTYPFLYRFVRTHNPQLDLPEVGWTQLYIDRVYQGLYLRAALPFDPRKKDGGSGVLRELLTVEGNRLTKVDTRFDAAGQLYASRVAEGRFPELSPPSPELAWLARRSPFAATTFLLANETPYGVTLLPLPISLPRLREAMDGRAPDGFSDERYRWWTEGSWRGGASEAAPYPGEASAEFRAAFEEYASSFMAALRIHAEVYQTADAVRERLPERQGALADLHLSLGEL